MGTGNDYDEVTNQSSVGDSANYSEVRTDDNNMLQSLQDSFDLSNIDLTKLTSEERQAEINRCKEIYKHYSRMMYLISSNSGWFQYSDRVNFDFIANKLKLGPDDKSSFDAKMGFCWSIKPLYGWISDSFYPFRYRIKSYILFWCSLHCATCLWVFNTAEPGFPTILWSNVSLNMCVAFIDALAEGISAVNTKMTKKILALKEVEKRETGNVLEDEGDNEMKSFGNFNLIRGMFRAIMGLAGGVMADYVSIQVSYLILAFYPVIMILYGVFMFKEQRKRTWFTSLGVIIKGLVLLFKVIIRPFILLPTIYMFLNVLLPPSAGETYNYILTRKAGVSIALLSLVDNSA